MTHVDRIRVLAPKVAALHDATRQSFNTERLKESEIFNAVIRDLEDAALIAISSQIQISNNFGKKTFYKQKGIKLSGHIKDGNELYLSQDKDILLLTYSISNENCWTGEIKKINSNQAICSFDLEDCFDSIVNLLQRQLKGNLSGRVQESEKRIKILQSVLDFLFSK